jgi:hypothetical protein
LPNKAVPAAHPIMATMYGNLASARDAPNSFLDRR